MWLVVIKTVGGNLIGSVHESCKNISSKRGAKDVIWEMSEFM